MNQEEKDKFVKDIEHLLSICDSYEPIKSDGSYTFEKVRECILSLADSAIQNKEECSALKEWMTEKTDFMKSPASTKFHGNFEHGLAVHSLVVVEQALRFAVPIMQNSWQTPICKDFCVSAEDVYVAAIAHDFCKADTYRTEFRNTKDVLGNWKKQAMYKTRSDSRNLGHGNESVLRLLSLMPSFIQKRYVLEAISRHMGFSDLSESEKYNYSVFINNPLVVLVQLADESAAHWFNL